MLGEFAKNVLKSLPQLFPKEKKEKGNECVYCLGPKNLRTWPTNDSEVTQLRLGRFGNHGHQTSAWTILINCTYRKKRHSITFVGYNQFLDFF